MVDPCQFAYRTSKGVGLFDAAPVYEAVSGFQKPEGNIRCCVYSPCGRYFAWASLDSVYVVDASVGLRVTSLPADNVYELGFSPRGTYIITWQRPSKDDNGDAVKNLKVWTVAGAQSQPEPVGRFVQKSQTGWNLQYTPNERYCARTVTNEVQIYESHDLGMVWSKIRVEGVADFALSPAAASTIAVFIPEHKGQPAAVKIFNVPDSGGPVSQKTFFKGDKVQLKWNSQGTSLIVLAQTEVDRSGKSYYGETTLYLLSANGGFDSRIELDKEGPIHDVAWSPSSKEFGVVYGYMPAKTTLYNLKATPTHTFPLGPRNTIQFSPFGRFVLVAGFGNLAGHIDIYDLQKDFAKVCTIQASNSSVCEWSPNAQYLLTATTSPRLRVDNGVRMWHVGGGLVYGEDMHELYSVTWRPQPEFATQSHFDPLHPVPAPHASAQTFLSTMKTPSKPAGAYRPPGARGTSTPLAFMREDQGGAAYVRDESNSFGASISSFGKPRRREVPGAEVAGSEIPGAAAAALEGDDNMSKAALKNKKKREARKAKDALGETSVNGTISDGSHNHLPARGDGGNGVSGAINPEAVPFQPGQAHPTAIAAAPASNGKVSSTRTNGVASSTSHATSEIATATDNVGTGPQTALDKKIRALTKKLRAIDDLKMRAAGGEALETTQIKKMETEDAVRRELSSLGWTD